MAPYLRIAGVQILLACVLGAATTFAVSRLRGRRVLPAAAGRAWEVAGIGAMGLSGLALAGALLVALVSAAAPDIPGMEAIEGRSAPQTGTVPSANAVADVRSAMSNLRTRQEHYYVDHGYTYSDDLGAVRFEHPYVTARIAFGDGDGWAGEVTDDASGDRCALVVGTVPQAIRVAVIGPGARADVPVCTSGR